MESRVLRAVLLCFAFSCNPAYLEYDEDRELLSISLQGEYVVIAGQQFDQWKTVIFWKRNNPNDNVKFEAVLQGGVSYFRLPEISLYKYFNIFDQNNKPLDLAITDINLQDNIAIHRDSSGRYSLRLP